MITQSSNQTKKLRTIPAFGDLAMLVALYRSALWKELYSNSKKGLLRVIKWLINVKVDMLASVIRSVFRYNPGEHTTGGMMYIWTLCMLIAFNSASVEAIVFTLIPFVAPVLLINIRGTEFVDILWGNVRSENIAYLIVVFAVFQLLHVIRIYLNGDENADRMKRGTSWIKLLFKHNKFITEFKIQCFVEPVFAAGIGYILWTTQGDIWIFILLSSSAICLFLQEFFDKAYQHYHK